MGAGLGGGGLAAGQTLVAPHAIPGPLPTAEPALPSVSHPQHSHTTTTTQPHPTATLPQPAPPTIYSIVQKILHISFPAVREFLQCNYTPGRQRPEANLLEFAASPIPHSPRSAAWPGAKLQPISHPGVQRRHQGTVSSLAQSLRASECAVHLTVSTRRH